MSYAGVNLTKAKRAVLDHFECVSGRRHYIVIAFAHVVFSENIHAPLAFPVVVEAYLSSSHEGIGSNAPRIASRKVRHVQ
jgi:hypothetical protein